MRPSSNRYSILKVILAITNLTTGIIFLYSCGDADSSKIGNDELPALLSLDGSSRDNPHSTESEQTENAVKLGLSSSSYEYKEIGNICY